jgi:hypothetical protein
LLYNFRLKGALAFALTLLAVALILPGAASARCTSGGLTPTEVDLCTPTAKAKLLPNGMLIPPKSAPLAVQQVIAAANKIRTKPYIWGGGHARWWDRGYDCSGAVSYALHGGDLIDSPMPSGPLAGWGEPGEGRWITVFTNPGHAYAVIAGYRWDTSGSTNGETGPRWREEPRDPAGFVARHPTGY